MGCHEKREPEEEDATIAMGQEHGDAKKDSSIDGERR
jgi:hypothetical protein